MFHALCVGNCIAQQLAVDQYLKLVGQTSRGCFLQTAVPSVWSVFLSEETPPGPLTINLPSGVITPIKQATAQTIALRHGILHFSNTVQLSLQNIPRWQTTAPLNPVQPLLTRQATIAEAIRIIQQRKPENHLAGILPDLLPMLAMPSLPSSTGGRFTDKLHGLIAGLHASDTSSLASLLASFLGQGCGLTPSGDDFLLGFFLTLHRWRAHLSLADFVRPLGRTIVELAKHQTTYLSSNLIECAIFGEADQRLINALDGLMTAEKCDLVWLDGLLTWGSSSGLDAFAGMILANDCRIARV
jgi:hypothetical protein